MPTISPIYTVKFDQLLRTRKKQKSSHKKKRKNEICVMAYERKRWTKERINAHNHSTETFLQPYCWWFDVALRGVVWCGVWRTSSQECSYENIWNFFSRSFLKKTFSYKYLLCSRIWIVNCGVCFLLCMQIESTSLFTVF